MSQVKIQKLATGGTFIIDGQEISGDNAMNAVRSLLGETTGGIMDALKDGAIVDYNSGDNTVKITNSNGQSLTNNYLPAGAKASVMDSKFKKDWGATFNTKTDQFKRELAQLRGVNIGHFNNTEKPVDLTQLRKGSGWFYTKDKDGNDVYLEGPANADRMAIIKGIRDYVEHYQDSGEEASKKKYNTSGWNNDNLTALRNYFANVGYADRQGYWGGLLDRIQKNGGKDLTDADKETLRLMGFDDGATVTGNGSTGITPADRTKWGNAGFGGLVDLLGNKAHLNDDGSLSLNDGESWGWNLGDLYGQNIWFNDDFYNSTYGVDGSFDPFRNLTLYNNRLYTLDNPTLARILNVEGGFNSLKRSGNWSDADNIIRTRFTTSNLDNPSLLGSENYSTFLSSNPNYRFSDLTGLFTIPNMEKDNQIIQYVDLGENSLVGPYRQYQYKYALLDPRGNKIKDLSSDELVSIENGTARETGLNTYKRISDPNNKSYNNRYYEDILDNNGEATGFRFYRNINDPDNDIILHMPKISASDTDNKDIRVPKEIAKILMENKNWINNVIGNAQNKKDFIVWMSNLVRSKIHFNEDRVDFSRRLQKMGFSKEEAKALQSALKTYRQDDRQTRRNKYLIQAPTFNKQGGLLKYQTGGKAGGSKVATGVTEKRIDTKNTNPKNSYTIGGGKENWTQADSLELGALIGDLGSLAAAFVPGANIASAATGAAASTARFAADMQRDTKGAGWNYLLNLGMDAATLLPIIGGGANSLKVVRAVKNALPTIIKAASVYGLGSAVVNSANKIANGEDWTLRDISTVLNAITAGVGLSKQGGLGKSTKTTKTKGYSENFKVGETEVTLNNKQITDIMKSSNQADALTNAIKARAKNASKEEINAALDKLLKSKQNIWQRIRRKEGDVVLNVKKKPNTSVEQIEAIEGRPLYNWWHGLGDSRAAYNARIVGDKKAWGKANLIKTTGGQKSTQTYWDGKSWKIVKQTQKAIPDGGWAYSSVQTSPGSTQSLLPAPISSQLTKVPTYSMQTSTTLEPALNTRTVTRGKGVKLNKNRYNLYDSQRIYVPQWINPFTKANYQSNVDQQPSGAVYQPSYKQGGKIIKAKSGLNFAQYTAKLGKPWLQKTNVVAPTDIHDFLNNATTAALTPKTTTVTDSTGVQSTYQGPSIRQAYIDNKYKAPTSLNYSSDQRSGGLWGNKWMLNKPNVDDAIRAGIAARAIYHDRDLQRQALGKLYQRQFQTPQFDRAKYNYSDIEQGYNESTKPYLESRFVTSDARDSMAFKLNKAQQLSGLAGQKNAQLTQRFNQINETNRQIDAQNEANRIQTANEKSQYLTNLNYQDAMLDSVTWNRLFSDVINPFGQQMSQQGRDAWNKDLSMNYQFDAQNAQRAENARIQGDLNREFMPAWSALSDAEKKQYGDLETYVYTTNPERYKEIVNGNPIYRSTMQDLMRKYSKGIGAGMLYYKSGGSTVNIKSTNKNQRSVQEQIAINSAKSAKRSVDELSKALLKMLEQLTK